MKTRGCAANNANGDPCRSSKLSDGDYCLMHSPEHAAEVAESRRLGGLRRKREATVSGAYHYVGLESVADIRRLIEIAVLDTLGLENSIARSRTLAYLAQTALKALEVGELESRISVIEQSVLGKSVRNESVFDSDRATSNFASVEAAD